MTAAMGASVQEALYAMLTQDAAVQAATGGAIHDTLPSGALPALYVLIGEERIRDAGDKTAAGAWHEVTVSVLAPSASFAQAKGAAAAVCDAIIDATPALTRGRVVASLFRGAQARREAGGARRIDLRFRIRTEDA